jgi:hypothetical protein
MTPVATVPVAKDNHRATTVNPMRVKQSCAIVLARLVGFVGFVRKRGMPPGAEPRRAIAFAVHNTRRLHTVGPDRALEIGLFVHRECRGAAEQTGKDAEFIEVQKSAHRRIAAPVG